MSVEITDQVCANVKLFENTGKTYVFLTKKRRGKETQSIGLSSDELAHLFNCEELKEKVEEMEMVGVSNRMDTMVRDNLRELRENPPRTPQQTPRTPQQTPRTPQQTPRTPYSRPFAKTRPSSSTVTSSSSYPVVRQPPPSTPTQPPSYQSATPRRPTSHQPPPPLHHFQSNQGQSPILPLPLAYQPSESWSSPRQETITLPAYQSANPRHPTSALHHFQSNHGQSPILPLPLAYQPSESWSSPRQETTSSMTAATPAQSGERRVVFVEDYDCGFDADTE